MGTIAGVCEAIHAAQAGDGFKATANDIPPMGVPRHQTVTSGVLSPTNKMLVWAPAQDTEPKEMLIRFTRQVAALGTEVEIVILLNGPSSERVCAELRQHVPRSIQVYAIPGPASIGRAQQVAQHLFLQSNADLLVRIDPDGQWPLSHLAELCHRLASGGADAIVAQRDEAGVAGRFRFVGNALLRLFALRLGIFADPNSGFYVMNRRAAAALCQVPLPKYPEARMLAWLKGMSLQVSSVVVPTLPRESGTSTIKGVGRAVTVFLSSLLELLLCEQL